MLFVLTGDIQTGKTRWLTGVLDRLRDDGVRIEGVLAPGVWVEHEAAADQPASFEKVAIDNILLPQGERVPFARRKDIAIADGAYDESSQSARSRLGWAIDDGAIARVNGHLRSLLRDGEAPGLLVLDELGRLEIRGGGLAAMRELLDGGATPARPHALVVVRKRLLDEALELLAALSWGGMEVIAPGDEGERALRAALGTVIGPSRV